MTLHEELALHGIGLRHHFGGGTYIKETLIPAHKILTQHVHEHDHLSVLCMGEARVTVENESVVYRGPCVIKIDAGHAHKVESLTEVIWLCVHATDETDPDKVDAEVVK
jgi:mannose-6-phosphate isomerase-like protein (cupin superfamily)